MGAWGYKPFENDSALDWLGGIERAIAVEIHKAFTRMDATYEAIAAAQLLLECTSKDSRICIQYDAMNWYTRRPRPPKRGTIRPATKSLFDIAIANLDKLYKSAWPDEWDEPASSRKTIGALRRALMRRQRILKRKAEEQSKRLKIVFARSRGGRYSGKRKPKAK